MLYLLFADESVLNVFRDVRLGMDIFIQMIFALCLFLFILCIFLVVNVTTIKLTLTRRAFMFLVQVFFLILSSFAVLFRIHGLLLEGDLVYLPPKEALMVSVFLFTSNGTGKYVVPETLSHIAALEAIIGFVMTPILLSLSFIILSRQRQK